MRYFINNIRSLLSIYLRLVVMLFGVACLTSSTSFGADLEKGRAAANRGDYAGALEEWLPLAQQGDSDAAYNLGRLFANGHGVKRDFSTAHKWFLQAANGGNSKAKLALSKMYEYGDGVEQDLGTAKKWRIASEQSTAVEPSQVAIQMDSNPAESSRGRLVTFQSEGPEPTSTQTAPGLLDDFEPEIVELVMKNSEEIAKALENLVLEASAAQKSAWDQNGEWRACARSRFRSAIFAPNKAVADEVEYLKYQKTLNEAQSSEIKPGDPIDSICLAPEKLWARFSLTGADEGLRYIIRDGSDEQYNLFVAKFLSAKEPS